MLTWLILGGLALLFLKFSITDARLRNRATDRR